MAEPSENHVETTRKSLKILELLQQEDGAGITEISAELGMSKSTVHSHLATLVDCGYVTHHEQQYHVSTKLLRLGGQLRNQSPLYKAAQAEMADLAAVTNGVARLYLKEQGVVTVIAQEGHHPNIEESHLGHQTPVTESIAGPVMLAEHEQNSDGKIADSPDIGTDLRERFSRIRRRGYAVESPTESTQNRTFAAAVSRRDGTVMGALTVTVSDEERTDVSPGDRLLQAVEQTELSLTSWYDSRVTFSPKHSWHAQPD